MTRRDRHAIEIYEYLLENGTGWLKKPIKMSLADEIDMSPRTAQYMIELAKLNDPEINRKLISGESKIIKEGEAITDKIKVKALQKKIKRLQNQIELLSKQA